VLAVWALSEGGEPSAMNRRERGSRAEQHGANHGCGITDGAHRVGARTQRPVRSARTGFFSGSFLALDYSIVVLTLRCTWLSLPRLPSQLVPPQVSM
jgi:hypothetical protein